MPTSKTNKPIAMLKSTKTAGKGKGKGPLKVRVVHARLPDELRPACEAISRHIRDLRNTSVHLARTALDCFAWDPAAKRSIFKTAEELPRGGPAVLAAFNAGIKAQNAKRTAKHGDKAKLLPPLDAACAKPASIILDATLFESTVRCWPDGLDPLGRTAYGRLPSCLAKHCVHQARGSFSTWLAQRKAWLSQEDKGGAGVPSMLGIFPPR